MKNRHETYRGIAKKKLLLSDVLADDQEIEEVLSERSNDPFGILQDEPDWDELGRIAEMEDFAERGLGLY